MRHRPDVLFVCAKNSGKSPMADQHPKAITDEAVRNADVVVTLGREAEVSRVEGVRLEDWDTDEPSERGMEGIQRMRLVRDDIAARIRTLTSELGISPQRPRKAAAPATSTATTSSESSA